MEMSKIVLIIQFTFALTCLLIQFYAICSARWASFESRIELGLIEEHGHYGLWSMCTYRKLIPAQVDDDGRIIIDSDCDSMDTFFTPDHPKVFISFFVICHALALIIFCSMILFRLIELYHDSWNTNSDDLEMNTTKMKRFFIIASRLMANRIQTRNDEEYYVRTQIRNKLYAISVAVLSTMLALAGALTTQQSLRDTDLLRNMAQVNYRVWRGPGFWAQMTTMIMDMLITTLIVIEVRVVFVQFHLQSAIITIEPNTIDNDETTADDNDDEIVTVINHQSIDDNFIVNPFFSNYHSNDSRLMNVTLTHKSKNSIEMTVPKMVSTPTQASMNQQSTIDGQYINSEQVRHMKNQRIQQQQQQIENLNKETAYCNPMYKDD
ncbi:uncharacterized protein LOC113797969 [Dermatophagoides pteronyssinus]|uniref:uncharacterized protein LOC113797969 n=1 Tax=Dermatophagoides pteronyssinus TaxID=6956 RepID=UPI003F660CF9